MMRIVTRHALHAPLGQPDAPVARDGVRGPIARVIGRIASADRVAGQCRGTFLAGFEARETRGVCRGKYICRDNTIVAAQAHEAVAIQLTIRILRQHGGRARESIRRRPRRAVRHAFGRVTGEAQASRVATAVGEIMRSAE